MLKISPLMCLSQAPRDLRAFFLIFDHLGIYNDGKGRFKDWANEWEIVTKCAPVNNALQCLAVL
jgi:hypothetical protein